MAVAKGLEDTRYYMLGCKDLYVATDHSSLVSILGNQSLADVQNPRLARIKERTLWWQFRIIHTPGKKQLAADAISRRSRRNELPTSLHTVSVTDESNDDQLEMFDELEATIRNEWCEVMAMVGSDKIEVVTWDMLYEETQYGAAD